MNMRDQNGMGWSATGDRGVVLGYDLPDLPQAGFKGCATYDFVAAIMVFPRMIRPYR